MPEPRNTSVGSELPRTGMLAHVRNRLSVIAAVEPYSHPEQLHWVRVEYLDQDGPPEDQVLWEREPNARVWPPTQLPNLQKAPMSGREFDAFVRATRWSAATPFFGPAVGDDPSPTLIAPLYSSCCYKLTAVHVAEGDLHASEAELHTMPKLTSRKRSSPPALVTVSAAERPEALTPLNFRVSETFHREFKVYAAQHGMSMVDLRQRSFELMKVQERNKK